MPRGFYCPNHPEELLRVMFIHLLKRDKVGKKTGIKESIPDLLYCKLCKFPYEIIHIKSELGQLTKIS